MALKSSFSAHGDRERERERRDHGTALLCFEWNKSTVTLQFIGLNHGIYTVSETEKQRKSSYQSPGKEGRGGRKKNDG